MVAIVLSIKEPFRPKDSDAQTVSVVTIGKQP